MKSIQRNLLLFYLLFLHFFSFPIDAQIDEITQLEKRILHTTFTQEQKPERLKRLEELVFGRISENMPEQQRIKRLQETFEIPTAKIPESFKKELEQAANNSPENTLSQANSSDRTEPKIQILQNNDSLSEQMLKIINQERSFRNLSPLALDPTAQKVALEHASFLVQTRQFSHYGLSGKNPDQRYSEAGGNGRLDEIVDGYFASVNEKQQAVPIEVSTETPNQLMDAFLKVPDKSDIIFSKEANMAGISFVRSPDKRQLVVVIEIIPDYASLAHIPSKSSGGGLPISGTLKDGYRLAWLGVSHKEIDPETRESEVQASPYFPPIDQVVYLDRSSDRNKTIAQAGAMILAIAAAPFTYGASMLVADIMMQTLAQTYQQNIRDVEVRGGVNADRDGSFSGTVGLGEWGPGLYYVSIWAQRNKSDKPVVVGRKAILVS